MLGCQECQGPAVRVPWHSGPGAPDILCATMRRKATLETPSIQSLGRGLTILEAVAESPEPMALRDLTGLLGIDRSSVFRLANTLRQRRFLTNPEGSNDFVLGPSVWRLSRRYGRHDMVSRCREQLRALSVKTGETAHLAVRDGRQALFVDHHVPTGQVLDRVRADGRACPDSRDRAR